MKGNIIFVSAYNSGKFQPLAGLEPRCATEDTSATNTGIINALKFQSPEVKRLGKATHRPQIAISHYPHCRALKTNTISS